MSTTNPESNPARLHPLADPLPPADGGLSSVARRFFAGVGVVLIVAFGVLLAGPYIGQKKAEANYQEVMQELQAVVSDYVVNNYAGVTKIEWQGVQVEFLAHEIISHTLNTNPVRTTARVYVDDTDYFTVDYSLYSEADYHRVEQKYVLAGTLTPENLDAVFGGEARNAAKKSDTTSFDQFIKSEGGSPGAEVVYNTNITKFDWA